MAKAKRKDEETVNEEEHEENSTPELPEGFETLGPQDGVQTWFRPKVGAVVHGRLLGRYARKTGKKQAFYQIKLISGECEGIQGKGDDAVTAVIGRGEVLNVNETKQLEELRSMAADDGVYDVHLTVLEKVKLENTNTFWRWRIAAKTLRKPTFKPNIAEVEGSSSDDDDLPF